MTLRMDNVLVVVDDLEAAIAFLTALGMEVEGRAVVEGEMVDHRHLRRPTCHAATLEET